MKSYIRTDVHGIERQIVNHVEYTVEKTRFNFTIFNAYTATAYSIRDRLIEILNDSKEKTELLNGKTVNYLSGEFMQGRQMQRNLTNLALEENY